MKNKEMEDKAVNAVIEYYNRTHDDKIDASNVLIVWSAKVIQNFKRTLIVKQPFKPSEHVYYEATYHGDKGELYLDVYEKKSKWVFEDNGKLYEEFSRDGNVAKDSQFLFEKVVSAPDDTVLPTRGTKESAGYDFRVPVSVVVPPHKCSELIYTNVKAKIPKGYYLSLHVRSSLAVKKGLMLVNNVGIIDADYYSNPDNDGNIGVKFYNFSDNEVRLEAGERVVQGILNKYGVTDSDNVEKERTGGYGSTGEK